MSLMIGNVASCFKDADELPDAKRAQKFLISREIVSLSRINQLRCVKRLQDTHYANR